jgi:hypothetical protein
MGAYFMEFNLTGFKIDGFIEQHRPFYVFCQAFGTKKYGCVYTQQFPILIDTGAGNTIINKLMKEEIFDAVYRETGKEPEILDYTSSRGMHGAPVKLPLYMIPCLCITDNILGNEGIRLTDVIVAVVDTNDVPCVLGRTILQCCVLTLNPEYNCVGFNFKENLKLNKPTMMSGTLPVYSEIGTFSEFSGLSSSVVNENLSLQHLQK